MLGIIDWGLKFRLLVVGVPGLDTIRSSSVPQLSSITLIFEHGTNLLEARQLVQERLTTVVPTLPTWACSRDFGADRRGPRPVPCSNLLHRADRAGHARSAGLEGATPRGRASGLCCGRGNKARRDTARGHERERRPAAACSALREGRIRRSPGEARAGAPSPSRSRRPLGELRVRPRGGAGASRRRPLSARTRTQRRGCVSARDGTHGLLVAPRRAPPGRDGEGARSARERSRGEVAHRAS